MQFMFDATTVAPDQGAGICFPLGDYPVEITKAEPVPTKNNPNVNMLVLTLTCLDGPMKGQNQLYRFNIAHENETTRRIAYSQLSAICHVIGRLQIQDTNQLVGGRFIATIGPQDSDPKYSEVKKVKDMQGNEPGRSAAPSTPPAQPPASAPFPSATAAPATPAAAPWGAPATSPTVEAAPPWATPPAGATAAAPPPWASK